MGTNYKAAIIPQRIRETIHGWGKEARRKRRHGIYTDDSTIHTETSTIVSLEENDCPLTGSPTNTIEAGAEIELQPADACTTVANEASSRAGTPLLRPSASVSHAAPKQNEIFLRSYSVPSRRN